MIKLSPLMASVILTGFIPLAIFAQDSIPVANPSFEQGYVGYPGYGLVPGWFAMTGISDATGPIWDNGGTVDGSYVGFMEGVIDVGQTNFGYQVGQTYWLQFFANSRAGETTTPDLNVYQSGSTLGGAPLVSPINIPVSGGTAGSGNPFTFVNIPFTAAASSSKLEIVGVQHGGSGSLRWMMDGVSIIQRSTNDVVIANPSFEASGTGQTFPGWVTAVAGWSKIGAGLMAINQASGIYADNGTIPDGGNVLVLLSGAGVSQTLNGLIPGMYYQLSLYVNSRLASSTPVTVPPPALVQIGGLTVYSNTVAPVGASNPYLKLTYKFMAAATNETLTIANASTATNDAALLVDNVRLVVQPPASITVTNPSFEQGYVGYPGYGSVPGWAGMTGINDTNGPIWNNGGTVDGSYVGFMEGSILASQTQSGYQVGQTYWLQFFANSRAGEATTPDLYVYQNGSTMGGNRLVPPINIPVSGGTAGSGNPFTFVNIPFTAAASSGLLQIVGLPHGSGNVRYMMDGFSIIQRSTNDVVIANPSFEASGAGQTFPGWVTAVAGWTQVGGGQLAINQAGGSFADNGTIPDGGNVLCLTSGAGVSQTLRGLIPGMNYQLSFYVNARAATASPSVLVQVGGSAAYNNIVAAAGGGSPYQTLTYTFTAAATNVTLIISNATPAATDSTLLVDEVRLVKHPDAIMSPSPAAGQGVPMTLAAPLMLSWVPSSTASAYDGYLGTSSNAVAIATTNTSSLYLGRTNVSTLNAGALQPNTTYYWRVDPVAANGFITPGAVMSFTTGNPLVDMMMDTWVATDALNRTLPGNTQCGPVRSDRPIGIYYFLTHTANINGNAGPNDNTKEIQRLGGYADAHNPWASNPRWNASYNGSPWYWGEPEAGYYSDDDEWVIRRQIAMLEAAGVDVIGIDVSNGSPWLFEPKYLKFMAVVHAMQMEGTPVRLKIVFYTFAGAGGSPATVTWLYQHFYQPGLYSDLWFMWQGKPLIMGYPNGRVGDGTNSTPVSSDVLNFFTWRTAGYYVSGVLTNEWQWIDTPTPQNWGWTGGRSDLPEQLPVTCGGWAYNHDGRSLGRSCANNVQPPYDNFHLSTGRTEGRGLLFSEQMFYGLKYDPQFLFITGWNEWVAGAWVAPTACYEQLLLDCTPATNSYFADAYTAEYSRDIEPMKGGFTDNYYYQMVGQNRLRKGVRPVPVASASQTINLAGSFSQWNNVSPAYYDSINDTIRRNWPSTFSNLTNYTDNTGRNDFTLLKVARDATNFYFLAQCNSNLTSYTGSNWMVLFINTDANQLTGWEGYDFAINLGGVAATTTTLSQNTTTNWTWTNVRNDIAYRVAGNQLMLAIPRVALGLTNDPVTFDFHWADNFQTNDISGFCLYGDSAPDRRFNYRYQSCVSQPVTLFQDNFENGKQTAWGATWTNGSEWSLTSTTSYSSNNCAYCNIANGNNNSAMINQFDTSALDSLRVSFYYKLHNVVNAQNLSVQYYSATGWVTVRVLSRDQYYPTNQAWGYDERQDVWLKFVDSRAKTGTNQIFFNQNFALRINASGVNSSGKSVWVDDFLATGTIAPTNNPPPAPWQTTDVGAPGVSGGTSYANGVFAVSGSGADIGGTNDQFQYVYQSRSGDGYLTARAVGQTPTDGSAKAGVMLRESLDSGARNVMMLLSASNGLAFQNRPVTNGVTTSITQGPTGVAPYWVRLVRSGNTFTGYDSTDGTSWTLVGTTDISGFSLNALWGMAVTAHNNAWLSTATFDNVAINQWPVIGIVNNYTLTAGQTLVVTNTATDPDVPAQMLTWSLLNAPTNTSLNSTNGLFSWRPTVAQSPASNLISLSVIDNGTPSLAATQSFGVSVLRPASPTISALAISNGVFGMAVSGDTGPDYRILTSTNLVQWTPWLTTNPPALPFWISDPSTLTNDHQFYRVLLGP